MASIEEYFAQPDMYSYYSFLYIESILIQSVVILVKREGMNQQPWSQKVSRNSLTGESSWTLQHIKMNTFLHTNSMTDRSSKQGCHPTALYALIHKFVIKMCSAHKMNTKHVPCAKKANCVKLHCYMTSNSLM